jgi:hypothetical protein
MVRMKNGRRNSLEMKVESSANELLLNIFERSNALDLLYAFHHLNYRFDTPFLKFLHGYNLDFRSFIQLLTFKKTQQSISSNSVNESQSY